LPITVPIVASDGREDHEVARHPNNNSQRVQISRRFGGLGRRLVATLLAVSALVPAYGALPNLALASTSCTGWKSTTVPPDYIRVGRSDGSVDVVPFRKYVGVASAREWPYWLPGAARRVGAIAVKQYGWYWTLAGHHRSGYVNANGKCYDVTDGTRDQLYKPEKTSVRRATWRAIDATWSITLRKNGYFFMTGYRTGAGVSCGADADGRLLYERSVSDCARQGKSTYAILKKYISGLTVLDGGATTTSLAATASPGPLAPTSQRSSKTKKAPAPAVTSASAWAKVLFPAPSLSIELVAALPAERALSVATLASADIRAWTVLRGWTGPRIG
jgi:hypothetical protein